MSATKHARRSRLARFFASLRYDPSRPHPPVVHLGPGVELPSHLLPETARTEEAS